MNNSNFKTKTVLKALRVELEPTVEQYEKMKRFAGCVNKVYNTLLADWKDFYNNTIQPFYNSIPNEPNSENYKNTINQLSIEKSKKLDGLTKKEIGKIQKTIKILEKKRTKLKKDFEKDTKANLKKLWKQFKFRESTELKKEFPYLNECCSQALANARQNVKKAFRNYFKGQTKFPKFHSSKRGRSFKTCMPSATAVNFTSHTLYYPKIENIKIKNRKPPMWYKNIKSDPKNITIRLLPNGRVFASILFEVTVKCICKSKVNKINENQVIGLDFDLHDFFITSDGRSAKKDFGWIPQKQSSRRLPHLQRQLARTKCVGKRINANGKSVNIYSKRHYKLAKRIANEEWRIANRRLDFLEKTALSLVKTYKVIAIEDLNIAGMKKVTKTQVLEDGSKKKTRQPHSNSHNYDDTSWATFVNLLEWKSRLYDCRVVKVDRFYPSSQECSVCHKTYKAVATEHLESWTCPHCGTFHASRDINAGINIKTEALRILREA